MLPFGAFSWAQILAASTISMVVSAVLIFTLLEYFIFSEINELFKLLERLSKREFKGVRKALRNRKVNPLSRLNKEIYTFAARKEREISDLKEIEIYRREFIADISHELKTPVFAAQGFIHTLLDGALEDPEVAEKFLQKAARSLDGLESLVNDLLTLSQMETGVLQMQLTEGDIALIVREVFDQLEHKAEQRSCKLILDARADRNYLVSVDKKRIRQVLINLIENAIKYGKPENGQVKVHLDAEKDGVTIAVLDDGPGIPGEHLSRIFERFYRVERSRNSEYGGSGLGLAIVKQIVEGHKSRISVLSKLGRGTQFSFKLKRFAESEGKKKG
jgi:two-component system phosphate regulon sensor histidine kinase PhoR